MQQLVFVSIELILVLGILRVGTINIFGKNNGLGFNIFANKNNGIDVLSTNEEAYMTVPQLVTKYGYPIVERTVTTEDGYILTVFRINGSTRVIAGAQKRVVFLQHSIFMSSASWVVSGPGSALAYILADAGYDVWLGNARGTTYSNRHVRYDPSQVEYWAFSWDQIGAYDLPAMIDLALAESGQSRLIYVGHGLGTKEFYVMCSERPEYNNKIELQISLGPMAYTNHIKCPYLQTREIFGSVLALVYDLGHPFKRLLENIFDGTKEWRSTKMAMDIMLNDPKCSSRGFSKMTCGNIIFLVYGYDQGQLDPTKFASYILHATNSSARDVEQIVQQYSTKKYAKYDFGRANKNLEAYGTPEPPVYDVSKATADAYLVYAKNDWLSDPIDVMDLINDLPNVKGTKLIEYDQWISLDYVWAKDAYTFVYSYILGILSNSTIVI